MRVSSRPPPPRHSPRSHTCRSLTRLIDRRFAGIAQGVGTAKILGRVHSAQLKLADLHLPCSFTIMEGRAVDFLFGLDMLKAHQACIDLEKSVLRIQGREVSFLPEHELPEMARNPELAEAQAAAASGSGSALGGAAAAGPSGAEAAHFPGTGHKLGAAPAPVSGAGRGQSSQAPQAATQSRYPEDHISMLVGLGTTREAAIRSLDAAGGNLDIAASLLFQ